MKNNYGNLKAPFPYFGGKSKVAPVVWDALGDVKQYIEPFFGSGAVLLNRPITAQEKRYEIICDKDGHIANLWRALQADPDAVANVCDWPCNHADLSARKGFLIRNENDLLQKLIADPDFYDVKMAGYWIWAASHWIGSGLTRIGKIPQLTNDRGIGQIPQLTNDRGIGKIPQLTNNQGIGRHVQDPYADHLWTWFRDLSARLRHVKVVCGDWSRVCGGNWQTNNKPCGMFFDPPYGVTDRDTAVYAHDSTEVAAEVFEWCLKRGNDPNLRIVIAGYNEHDELLQHGWTSQLWTNSGGFGNQADGQGKANRHRECLYFSPYCQKTELF